MIEKWHNSLGNSGHAATLPRNPLRAFDYVDPGLMIAKVNVTCCRKKDHPILRF